MSQNFLSIMFCSGVFENIRILDELLLYSPQAHAVRLHTTAIQIGSTLVFGSVCAFSWRSHSVNLFRKVPVHRIQIFRSANHPIISEGPSALSKPHVCFCSSPSATVDTMRASVPDLPDLMPNLLEGNLKVRNEPEFAEHYVLRSCFRKHQNTG